MNCLIILLLLACGGCRGGQSCGCGNMGNGNVCCQRDTGCDNDCPCQRESRGPVRCPGGSDEHDCHDHHDHHDHDHRPGGPAAWSEGREGRHNNYPSISGGETCGCDAE